LVKQNNNKNNNSRNKVMKDRISRFPALSLAVVAMLITLNAQLTTVFAQGTAFTYQGRLASGANAANGIYDFQFQVFDAATAGSSYGNPNPNSVPGVGVTNGLFTVTLDFGNVFPGDARWLQISVRTNGAVSFTTLASRQQLTPTPYAIYSSNSWAAVTASSAAVATTVANNGVTTASIFPGAVTSAGILDGTIQTNNLSPFVQNKTFWRLDGNAGTTPGVNFVGTKDNQALELWANSLRAFRLEPGLDNNSKNSPNVIGGYGGNYVSNNAAGATIAGGGLGWTVYNVTNNITNAISFNYLNLVLSDFGTIGGGLNNTIQTNSYASTIGGGEGITIDVTSDHSTIGGGNGNSIQAYANSSTIGGGSYNRIYTAWRSTIGGGIYNTIQTNAYESTIGGGYDNTIQTNAFDSTIGGGIYNTIQTNAHYSTIGGGLYNAIQTSASSSTIGGGWNNTIQSNAYYATIPGGAQNVASGQFSLAAGQQAQAMHNGSFVWADSSSASPFSSTTNNEFSIRAANGVHVVTDKGIHLNAADEPIIVRDWDVFANNAPTYKAGIGRWGLFMEPTVLTLGIPGEDVGGRYFQVAKYSTNGTPTTLMWLDQNSTLTLTNLRANGMIRLGSETGAAPPNYPNANGLIIRGVYSAYNLYGTLVARTDTMVLYRDGTYGGLYIFWTAYPGLFCVVNATGVTTAGAQVAMHYYIGDPSTSGNYQVFSDSANVSHYDISFGSPRSGYFTHIVLDRSDGDFEMVGTITSTYNQ
jgi:hypothetical protein